MSVNSKLYTTKIILSFIACGLLLAASSVQASTKEFPELSSLHDTIRFLWHDCYPSGDMKAAREKIPELEQKVIALEKAKIPVKYGHREEAFQTAVGEIKKAVDVVKEAAIAGDDKLKESIENLHDAFRSLMEIAFSRPTALDDFHTVMSVMWHDDYAAKNLTSLKTRLPELSSKIDALLSTKLGPRFKKVSEEDFQREREVLNQYVQALAKAAEAGNEEATWQALDNMHNQYQKLDELFN